MPSFDAENTSCRPSGEMAKENGSSVEDVFTSTRISGGAGGVVRLKYKAESAPSQKTATKQRTAAIPSKTFDLRRDGCGTAASATGPV